MTQPGLVVADAIANQLVDPAALFARAPEHWQHLAHGPSGIALLHIERAAHGTGPWERAHNWLAAASHRSLTSGPDSHPFYGAPAFAHALACAAESVPGSYEGALRVLDRQLTADAQRRVERAHRRIDAGLLPQLAEFDAIRGVAGCGAYLLRRDPHSSATRAVLDYCVRLTEPICHRREQLPGWWTESGPSGRLDSRFAGGHGNNGMAHGISGVLALLALAARNSDVADSHRAAMRTILTWLDTWRIETAQGPTWPYWVTRSELRTGRPVPSTARRPSWCYGTVGLVRAQQLAALALGDVRRQIDAENSLVLALNDPEQISATRGHGLCHGLAGLAHVATRTAHDAHSTTTGRIRATIPDLLAALMPPGTDPELLATRLIQDKDGGPGLLDGAAGTALALLAAASNSPPQSAWDSCLLLA